MATDSGPNATRDDRIALRAIAAEKALLARAAAYHLLPHPLGRRVCRDIEINHLSTVVCKDDENI